MGLFKEVQYINMIAAVLNIVLSVFLGKKIGVAGVIVATSVSRIMTSFWYEGKVVFRRFGKPVSTYFLLQMKSVCVCVLAVVLSCELCSYVEGNAYVIILVKLLIAVSISFFGSTAQIHARIGQRSIPKTARNAVESKMTPTDPHARWYIAFERTQKR